MLYEYSEQKKCAAYRIKAYPVDKKKKGMHKLVLVDFNQQVRQELEATTIKRFYCTKRPKRETI